MHRLPTLFFLGITALRTLAGEGFVSAGKLRIHYIEQGSGPALVFLHAGYQDANMWHEQQVHFAGRHRTIAIDLPGQGATTGVDTSLLIADALKIVFDSLHIERADLVGAAISPSGLVSTLMLPRIASASCNQRAAHRWRIAGLLMRSNFSSDSLLSFAAQP